VLEKYSIPGKIILLGTPGLSLLEKVSNSFLKILGQAEEGGDGKVILLEKGAYEGMDVTLSLFINSTSDMGEGATPPLVP